MSPGEGALGVSLLSREPFEEQVIRWAPIEVLLEVRGKGWKVSLRQDDTVEAIGYSQCEPGAVIRVRTVDCMVNAVEYLIALRHGHQEYYEQDYLGCADYGEDGVSERPFLFHFKQTPA